MFYKFTLIPKQNGTVFALSITSNKIVRFSIRVTRSTTEGPCVYNRLFKISVQVA